MVFFLLRHVIPFYGLGIAGVPKLHVASPEGTRVGTNEINESNITCYYLSAVLIQGPLNIM